MPQQDCDWCLPPDTLVLNNNEVHVWRAALEQSTETRGILARTLATDEAARAARFHFERDRQHYTVGRGILRTLLGHYLKRDPQTVVFTYGPQQKPALAPEMSQHNLQFNLSHSHGQALYAFSLGRVIGIDIEQIRPLDDAEGIARRFFSERDYATFIGLPRSQRNEGFFNCWTRKEAYIKALGEGLSHPLDTFDVTLAPGDPAQLLAVRGDPHQLDHWSMMALTPIADYAAAIIAEGQNWSLKCWDWDEGNRALLPK